MRCVSCNPCWRKNRTEVNNRLLHGIGRTAGSVFFAAEEKCGRGNATGIEQRRPQIRRTPPFLLFCKEKRGLIAALILFSTAPGDIKMVLEIKKLMFTCLQSSHHIGTTMCQSVNWQGLSSKKSRLFLKVALKCRIVLNLHSKGNRKTRNPLKILGFRALILSFSKAVYVSCCVSIRVVVPLQTSVGVVMYVCI